MHNNISDLTENGKDHIGKTENAQIVDDEESVQFAENLAIKGRLADITLLLREEA